MQNGNNHFSIIKIFIFGASVAKNNIGNKFILEGLRSTRSLIHAIKELV